ncbi:MAG TPA: hypothetical protein VNA25_11525, partial [Phycisphaerae bacterium]|nr:hypothetical protein [Phycisphaerae bacterium]
MTGRHYYLVTALPPIGELGSTPPLPLEQLLEHVADAPGPRLAVRTVLLSDDLLQRQSIESGQSAPAVPVVLTVGQLRGEEPLPEYLTVPEHDPPRRVAADAVWASYYRYAVAAAGRAGCAFLAAWVAHEVAMRNALAAARAKALALEPADYLVAEDLAGADDDFNVLISQWASAPNPLEALRVLDRGRWNWLLEHDGWFSFGTDELAAYAA